MFPRTLWPIQHLTNFQPRLQLNFKQSEWVGITRQLFLSSFLRQECAELEPRLAALSSGSTSHDINALSSDLASLRKALVDAINEGYLPAYDQRQLELVRHLMVRHTSQQGLLSGT